MTTILRFGHAKVDLKVEGCMKCGTPWSHHWRTAKQIPYRIGHQRGFLELSVCGRCDGIPEDYTDSNTRQVSGREQAKLDT